MFHQKKAEEEGGKDEHSKEHSKIMNEPLPSSSVRWRFDRLIDPRNLFSSQIQSIHWTDGNESFTGLPLRKETNCTFWDREDSTRAPLLLNINSKNHINPTSIQSTNARRKTKHTASCAVASSVCPFLIISIQTATIYSCCHRRPQNQNPT